MSFYLRICLMLLVCSTCSFSNALCQSKDSAAQAKSFAVSDILLQGNRITKRTIILRELTFKKGDTIVASQWSALAERSRDNLMNTSLFNRVQLDTIRMAGGTMGVMIQMQERWYLWPYPILQIEERNFNTWWVQDHHRLDKADYGAYADYFNVFGLMQTLRLRAQFGYTKQFGFGYTIPYLTRKQNGGLNFVFNYSQNREMPYTSVNNTLIYLHCPNLVLKREYDGTVDYTYRQGLYDTHTLEADIFSCSVNDTILKLTDNYLPFNQGSATFFETKYYFKRDLRDYAPYPLTGYFFDFSINEYGMGMKINNKPFNLLYLQSSFHKYWKITPRFYYSIMAEGKISQSGIQPYYIEKALGYGDDFVRGYELYVIDGNNYALVKNEIKFQIFNVPAQTIPLIGIKQFSTTYYALYLTAFSDWGYVDAKDAYVSENNLAGTSLWGNGFGLDFVTYYNLVFRFEYSFNLLGQSGFFIHFIAPM